MAGERSLFGVGIFICSPIPFSKSIQHGIDTRTHFGLKADAPSRPGAPSGVPDYLITDAAYLNGEEEEVEDMDSDVEDNESIRFASLEGKRTDKLKGPSLAVHEISIDSDSDGERSGSSIPAPSVSDDSADSNVDTFCSRVSNSLVFTSSTTHGKIQEP